MSETPPLTDEEIAESARFFADYGQGASRDYVMKLYATLSSLKAELAQAREALTGCLSVHEHATMCRVCRMSWWNDVEPRHDDNCPLRAIGAPMRAESHPEDCQ